MRSNSAVGEPAGLGEDLRGHGGLAEVVQRTGGVDQVPPLAVHVHRPRDRLGELRDTALVTGGVGIAGLGEVRQRLDGALDRALQQIDGALERVVGPPRLAADGRLPQFALDGRHEAGQVLLDDEVLGAGLHGRHGGLLADRTGHDQHGDLRIGLADERQRLEAAEPGEVVVDDDDVPRARQGIADLVASRGDARVDVVASAAKLPQQTAPRRPRNRQRRARSGEPSLLPAPPKLFDTAPLEKRPPEPFRGRG